MSEITSRWIGAVFVVAGVTLLFLLANQGPAVGSHPSAHVVVSGDAVGE